MLDNTIWYSSSLAYQVDMLPYQFYMLLPVVWQTRKKETRLITAETNL